MKRRKHNERFPPVNNYLVFIVSLISWSHQDIQVTITSTSIQLPLEIESGHVYCLLNSKKKDITGLIMMLSLAKSKLEF